MQKKKFDEKMSIKVQMSNIEVNLQAMRKILDGE